MSKLRQSAKGQSCTFRIPGVCNGDPETTVLCHAPHPMKGMGYKSHPAGEIWAAYGCSSCHDVMDGRAPYANAETPYTSLVQEQLGKELTWYRAIRETQTRMVKAGLIKV